MPVTPSDKPSNGPGVLALDTYQYPDLDFRFVEEISGVG